MRRGELAWRAFTDPSQVRTAGVAAPALDRVHGGQARRSLTLRRAHRAGSPGLRGYREVTPPQRLVQTFEWDGTPGHVAINDTSFEDLGDGRTKVVMRCQFHTTAERDGMLKSGWETGLNQSYVALDKLLAAPYSRSY